MDSWRNEDHNLWNRKLRAAVLRCMLSVTLCVVIFQCLGEWKKNRFQLNGYVRRMWIVNKGLHRCSWQFSHGCRPNLCDLYDSELIASDNKLLAWAGTKLLSTIRRRTFAELSAIVWRLLSSPATSLATSLQFPTFNALTEVKSKKLRPK